MKKFFIAVISLVIFTMVAYGVAYVVMPVNSMELTRYTHSVSFVCENAYIVRDETVYYATTDGIVYNISEDGDRVAQDESVCTVYSGDVDRNTLKQLHTIDTKISRLKTNGHVSDLYKTDSDSSENRVADKMGEVFELARENDVAGIHDIKDDINNLRKGASVSENTRIDILRVEREKTENAIASGKKDIISDRSGIFSSYVDGLETVLSPDRAEEYTPAYINALKPDTSEYINGKKIVSGTPLCKVMNNHIWYIAGVADSERAEMLKENKNVTVRFTNLTENDVEGEISYIGSPDSKGNCVFMVKVGTYVESAFSYRTVDAEIIFEEHSGYKVPTDAIRTGEGISDYYVYARKGSDAYKCDVNVLYSDPTEGYSIIVSKEKADNNLGSMDRLIVGER